MGIVTRMVVHVAITALAFGITAWLLSGVELSGGVLGALWVSILFGLVNGIVGTIVRLLTLPFMLLTLGLLAIVINALMLELTDALTGHLSIDEFFWTAIWASIILSIVLVVLEVAFNAFVGRRETDVPRSVPA